MKQPKSVKDIAKNPGEPLAQIVPTEQVPLPPPFDDFNEEPKYAEISDKAREKYVVLDDTIAVNIEKPKTKEEEEEFVQSFLRGLERCMNKEDNWTFLQPFEMSMEHCAHCQTCSDACHIYEESGENELYRPIYRSEILRRIYFKYIKKESTAVHGDIEINFDTVARSSSLPTAATCAAAVPRPAPSAWTTACSRARSARSPARRWASHPRNSTTTAPCCSSRPDPPPA
jgi:ferredoxin